MFVFAKDLETKRFRAITGMPVPPKYTSPHCIRLLREKYGQDVIKEVTRAYIDPEQMLEYFAGSSNDQAKKLAVLCASQEKTIESQSKEITKLKAQLKSREEARKQGAN